jgi:hypothetical protein
VNTNGGAIEGNVQTPEHKPAASSMVVLVPPAGDRQNAMKYKTAPTDEKGNFTMKGVPPGEYTLYAWESVPFTAWMNSDFLAKYQNRGRAVVVSQGIPDNINQR